MFVLNFLVPLILALASTTAGPSSTTTPAASATCYGCCPCPIGMKDWGK
jgi:hypothetical protein